MKVGENQQKAGRRVNRTGQGAGSGPQNQVLPGAICVCVCVGCEVCAGTCVSRMMMRMMKDGLDGVEGDSLLLQLLSNVDQ